MYIVEKETIKNAYRPFDIVTNENGDVGIITEVSVNECQPEPSHQIRYSIRWLVGLETKIAWWEHRELTYHCNMFIKLAEEICHPFGNNSRHVKRFFE